MNLPLTSRAASRGLALAAALCASVGTGCTLGTWPPEVASVTPHWGYNGEATDVVIDGEHFFPNVVVSGAEDGNRVDATFKAWIEADPPVELSGVELLSYSSLVAEVPAGIRPGLYALRVEAPSGLESTLTQAFAVTDTRADHLALDFESAGYTVGDYARLGIQLQDPAEQPVTLAIQVDVRVESDLGAAGVSFFPAGLENQALLEDGVGVRGTLGADGSGILLLTSDLPDNVTITVQPTDPESVVRQVSQILTWEAGSVADVEIVLPADDFVASAGEPFEVTLRLRDALGNLLDTEAARLVLVDACGSFLDPEVRIVGEGTVEVVLTDACASDRLYAYAFDSAWESASFPVNPGPVVTYSLGAAPDVVIAGTGVVVVVVSAVDAYGNVVVDHTADVLLFDDVGGLDRTRGMGWQNCPGFDGGVQFCTVSLWVASSAATIRAEDANAISGYAEPVAVLAGPPARVGVSVAAGLVAAGDAFEVEVRVADAYGNRIAIDPSGADPVLFTDDSGTIVCVHTGSADLSELFTCTVVGAVPDAHVTAAVRGLTGMCPDATVVTNAALEAVEVGPVPVTVPAGEPFSLALLGYDAYGNPYVVQTDPQVDLTDGSITFSPGTALLGGSGAVLTSATIRSAGAQVRIHASQGGVVLGTSVPIAVTAAALDAFVVSAPAWIADDAPGSVVVTAVDGYGNSVADYAGVVTLSADGGSCDPEVIDAFVGGSQRVAVTCGTPALTEVLRAIDLESYSGESWEFDVVDFACAGGPSAVLELDGAAATTRCLTSGTVDIDADASSSIAGDNGIAVYHFDGVDDAPVRGLARALTLVYESTGARYVELVTVDSAACADITGGYVYVGTGDGTPTGVVAVTPAASSVDSLGRVSVSLSAADCAGAVASGESLLLFADLGAPDASPTGEGLEITLDAAGESRFDWVFDKGYGGTATVHVGTRDGAAIGSESVLVTNEVVHPQVVEMSPSGTGSAPVSAIDIQFNEPMWAVNITSFYITVAGPGGSVAASYALSADLTTLTITPSTPIDPTDGTWTVGLSSNLRDVAGNRLDGAWAGPGSSGPYTGVFGDVAEILPTVSSCTASVLRFVPDGDDGVDEEADAVVLTPFTTGAPTWWWLEVWDAEGSRVRSLREAGVSATVSFTGRGDDGLILSPGTYEMTLSPVDANGNIGEGCDVDIEIDQHVVFAGGGG